MLLSQYMKNNHGLNFPSISVWFIINDSIIKDSNPLKWNKIKDACVLGAILTKLRLQKKKMFITAQQRN
jgi:hypothetical protein